MKTAIVILIASFSLSVLASAEDSAAGSGPEKVSKAGVEPGCIYIKDDDTAMQTAVQSARRRVGQFIAAVKSPSKSQRSFEVKKPIVEGDKVEQVWLRDVTYDGKRFHGRVDNQCVDVKGVKMGDKASVAPEEVSDWMFVENDKLVGGYTVRELYKRLSPEQQKEFEKESDFRIQ